ncbi:hypothetical protein BB561_002310 [Smittium simulii]|uniref:ER membrane protein complex subunit 2 n=1 Tax=Smittium simulii TaxID=133385 RepID=A0A2T9YQU7_9FUNG|nr:hypothetical protein BB561_002310 [Smittium simulii]
MKPSFANSIKLLDSYRKSGEAKAVETVQTGKPLVESGKIKEAKDDGNLMHIAWTLYEQITIAALITCDFELATTCINALTIKFPKSTRVKKLVGMEFEAKGQHNQALEKYNELLEIDPSNSVILKRKLATLLSVGEALEAIKSLVKYIDIFPNDSDAWIKLCELYLNEHMYAQAAFCVEELIILAPSNNYYYLKYAEIQYTLGNVDTALSYYLKVTQLSRDNLHGFYGVKLCTGRLLKELDRIASSETKKKVATLSSNLTSRSVETLNSLDELATERILHCYSSNHGVVEKLASMSIGTDPHTPISPASKKVVEEWLKL